MGNHCAFEWASVHVWGISSRRMQKVSRLCRVCFTFAHLCMLGCECRCMKRVRECMHLFRLMFVCFFKCIGAYLKYACPYFPLLSRSAFKSRSAASIFMQRAVARVLVLLLYSLGEIMVSLSLYLLLALLVFSIRLLHCSITITSWSVSVWN